MKLADFDLEVSPTERERMLLKAIFRIEHERDHEASEHNGSTNFNTPSNGTYIQPQAGWDLEISDQDYWSRWDENGSCPSTPSEESSLPDSENPKANAFQWLVPSTYNGIEDPNEAFLPTLKSWDAPEEAEGTLYVLRTKQEKQKVMEEPLWIKATFFRPERQIVGLDSGSATLSRLPCASLDNSTEMRAEKRSVGRFPPWRV
jgi:hypothetical protein